MSQLIRVPLDGFTLSGARPHVRELRLDFLDLGEARFWNSYGLAQPTAGAPLCIQ